MKNLAVALDARVSSDQPTQAQPIASQVAALRDRVTADDCVLLPECEVIDEGYSGATLLRPGLECLRDLSASGGIERL
jgi:site-specific DNA recombinase